MLHIKSVRYVSEFTLWVVFDDGTEGQVDLDGQLQGPIFAPLRDREILSKVSVDPELATLVWPNGADLAPEFVKELHSKQNNDSPRQAYTLQR